MRFLFDSNKYNMMGSEKGKLWGKILEMSVDFVNRWEPSPKCGRSPAIR